MLSEAVVLADSLNGQAYDTSLSIGVVIFMGDTESINNLLKKADQAMYQAKADGSQGVCFDAPSSPEPVDQQSLKILEK
ncbi:MAG: hypothetical protein FD135_4211 [Comamonadaceae bacterium]|nr:MAG: hypothetical protein FD135_4211 [Comamonadaceae bacterium]